MVDTNNKERICKNCNISAIKDYERGEYFCPMCGEVVISEIYDLGLETRYTDETNTSRVSLPTSQYTTEVMSTDIDMKNKDAYGKSFNIKTRMQNNLLRLWQKRLRITTIQDKNLISAISEVERICNHFSLSEDVKEECIEMYKKLCQDGLAKGKSISGLICAILYIIAIRDKKAINLEEINRISKVKKRRITKLYRILINHLDVKLELPTIKNYIEKYITYTNIQNVSHIASFKALCFKFSDIYQDELETGKGPLTVTCALIYVLAKISNIEFDLKEFIKKVKITRVTFKVKVKNLVELILENNRLNLNQEILKQIKNV